MPYAEGAGRPAGAPRGMGLLWPGGGDREGGYAWSPPVRVVSGDDAVISHDVRLDGPGAGRATRRARTVRLQVTPGDPADVVFVGVGRTDDVVDQLSRMAASGSRNLSAAGEAWGEAAVGVTADLAGGHPALARVDADTWSARSTAVGTRTLTWTLPDGNWTIVVLPVDGEPRVSLIVRTGGPAARPWWTAGGIILGDACCSSRAVGWSGWQRPWRGCGCPTAVRDGEVSPVGRARRRLGRPIGQVGQSDRTARHRGPSSLHPLRRRSAVWTRSRSRIRAGHLD
jgi:hypothetical protein